MNIYRTEVIDIGANRALVTIELRDSPNPEACRETISLTVEVEIVGSPYLKEVQREALEKAHRELDLQIGATKTVPRPSS